jgi:hypothetical protein
MLTRRIGPWTSRTYRTARLVALDKSTLHELEQVDPAAAQPLHPRADLACEAPPILHLPLQAATERTSQRVVLDGVLSAARCARLAWLLRALAHTGYRPHVESLNTWEVARCDPRLLPQLVSLYAGVQEPAPHVPTRVLRSAHQSARCARTHVISEDHAGPFRGRLTGCRCPAPTALQVAARQVVLQAVEQAFGREAELYIEWSGLVAWGAGSGIDWHADNARWVAGRGSLPHDGRSQQLEGSPNAALPTSVHPSTTSALAAAVGVVTSGPM